ncbi:MAG: MG2 domain-containing protein, partial [bacterium]|nr:MG2 domain-containing protein [bacterium]
MTLPTRSATLWLLLLLVLINGYAAVMLTRWLQSQPRGTQTQVEFLRGTNTYIESKNALCWEFSAPMAAPDHVKKPTSTGPVTLTPAVPGTFTWYSPSVLLFTPITPWPACTEFRAELDEAFVRAHKLNTSAAAFTSAPLTLTAVDQLDLSAARELTVRLTFNAAPNPQQLAQFVTIICNNHPVRFDIIRRTPDGLVTLKTASITADTCQFKIAKGLMPAQGTLGVPADITTSLTLLFGVQLRKCESSVSSFEASSIDAYFSTPLDLASAKNFIDIQPALDFSVERLGSWRGEGCTLNGAFAPGAHYTITFRKGLKSTYGNMLMEDAQRVVYMPDCPAALAFRTPGHYLSPAGSLLVPLSVVNVPKATITTARVYPNNLVYFATRQARTAGNDNGWWNDSEEVGLSEEIDTRELQWRFVPNVVTQEYLSLRGMLGPYRAGAYTLSVHSEKGGSARQLVIVTDIGLAVQLSARDLLVWANTLHSLAPVSGAVVRVYSSANQQLFKGVADAQGLAHFTGDLTAATGTPFLVTAQAGDDLTYLRLDNTRVAWPQRTDGMPYLDQGYEACVLTDRGVYRPGETVHCRVLVRDRALQCPPPCPVTLRVLGPDDRVVRTLPAMLNDVGAGEFALELPRYARTGRYQLECRYPQGTRVLGATSVRVEDFMPPQIKVQLAAPDTRMTTNYAVGVTADYLFGRPAAGARVSAAVTFEAAAFAPAQWPEYTFADEEKKFGEHTDTIGSGTLDQNGTTRCTIEVPRAAQPPAALSATMRATVLDDNGRAVSAYLTRAVDVYLFYLGLRLPGDTAGMRANTPLAFDIAAVWPDGAALSSSVPVTVELERVNWSSVLKRRDDGTYHYESVREVTRESSTAVLLHQGVGRGVVTPARAGQYLLRIRADETPVSVACELYVSGADDRWQAWSREQPGTVELQSDKPAYLPGETARIVIKAPFAGRALLTVISDRVLERHVIELRGNTAEYSIPLLAAYAPNVYCAVDLIRAVQPDDALTIHRAIGVIPLRVCQPNVRAHMTLGAPPVVRPMNWVTVAVAVASASNQPCEVALAAVDKAICMLTAFTPPDPLAYFEQQRALAVSCFDIYSLLMPEIGARQLGAQSAPGGDGFSDNALQNRLNPVDARRFTPVALWRGNIRTDARGQALIPLLLPEFAGTLQLMATAAGRTQLGATNMTILVKRPLVVRSSLPRCLAPGDRCNMPLRVFNESGTKQTVTLRLNTDGPLAVAPVVFATNLAAGAQWAVQAEVTALASVGVARVTLNVESASDTYAETTELPVRPPAPFQTCADTLAVASGQTAVVTLPSEWLDGTARNTVLCSTLPGVALRGALEYLLQYPYGCIEQTVSSALPLLYLADLAAELQPGSMTRADVTHFVDAAILRVLSMQQYNGGFSYWPASSGDVYPWGSVYALHFLVEAQRAGYAVPEECLNNGLTWLEQLLAAAALTRDDTNDDAWHNDACTRAYACYVLALGGRAPHGWIARLREQREMLDTPTIVNLAGALTAAGMRREALELMQQIGTPATTTLARQDDGCLNSDARTLAVQLALWLDLDPTHAQVPVLVQRLNGLRVNGAWYTTQDNAMALMALGKYARYQHGQIARVAATIAWNAGAETHALVGTNIWAFTPQFNLAPMVTLSNAGPGTLYCTWASSGVPRTGVAPEVDRQLRIRRILHNRGGAVIATNVLTQGELYVVELMLDPCGVTRNNVVITD